jgi:transposase-like protein
MKVKRNDIDLRLSEVRLKLAEIRHTYGLDRRRRCKPREQDRRRKYTCEEDHRFWDRYKQLKCNQSALARELGISQPAVRKRLIRVRREISDSASKLLTYLQVVGILPRGNVTQ